MTNPVGRYGIDAKAGSRSSCGLTAWRCQRQWFYAFGGLGNGSPAVFACRAVHYRMTSTAG